MLNHLFVLVASMGPMLSSLPIADAEPRALGPREALVAAGASGGIRTERLSGKKLEVWNAIVEIVEAEDADGRPLHPTLRELWNTVETSGHVVYVELPEPKDPISCFAGQFRIERVDPEGKAHVGVLMMNLRTIDMASTRSDVARADGFIPFDGLSEKERYAEVLGHELAHAVWSLAATERARFAMELQSETKQVMLLVLQAAREGLRRKGLGGELQKRMKELDRLKATVEEPAEAAEVTIWEELRASS